MAGHVLKSLLTQRLGTVLFACLALGGNVIAKESSDKLAAEAERLFHLDNYAKASPLWLEAERKYSQRGEKEKALYARISRLRGDSETILSYPVVAKQIAAELDTPLVRGNPRLRLRCLIV